MSNLDLFLSKKQSGLLLFQLLFIAVSNRTTTKKLHDDLSGVERHNLGCCQLQVVAIARIQTLVSISRSYKASSTAQEKPFRRLFFTTDSKVLFNKTSSLNCKSFLSFHCYDSLNATNLRWTLQIYNLMLKAEFICIQVTIARIQTLCLKF